MLAHQEGRSDEAVALIKRSLELEPDRADWHSNLGIVLRDRLQLDEAIAACQRAIALDPNHANAHNNLGVLLRAQGKPVEAEAAYRAAIRVSPEHSDAYTNLGILLNGQKRIARSGHLLLQGHHVQAEAPGSPETAGAGALHARRASTRRWASSRNGSRRSRTIRSPCTCSRRAPGAMSRPRASDGFVEKTFDSFAGSFDSKLATAAVPRARAGRGGCWRIRSSRRRRASTCSMPDAAPGCAARSSRRMRDGWWGSTCRRAC